MPVAPVVKIVMTGNNSVFMQRVGVEEGVPADRTGVTVIVPVALTEPQPPVKGML